jgi:hypothetical protein
MNKPTQEQMNQILEFIDSNTDKYEHDKELVKLTWQKAQDEIKLAMLEEIEEIIKFIENRKAKDSHGRLLDNFDKLCFVLEDLEKLKQSLGGGK